MERYTPSSEQGHLIRRIARLIVALAAACLIAYVLGSLDLGPRSALFDTIGTASAEAGEKSGSDLARLRLLTRCVGYVRSNYVVPARTRPLPMFVGALRGAESVIPDLMITPDADDPEKARSVVVRVGDQQRTFDIRSVSDLYEMNWKLLDVFEFIADNLPGDVKADEVEYAAINGLLAPLDEHSVYLPPRAYREMKLDTQGRFGGLGIVITTRKGVVTVVSVLPDTPASRIGLKSGDQILEIGDESTMNLALNDAVSKLRGDPGTKVSVLVQRKGWSEPKPFVLTRAEIRVRSVSSEILGDGIGYVRIKHFQEDTGTDLGKHLAELKRKGSLHGLVLDLRQNPGGLLEQAVEVSNLFIRKGIIVVTEGEGSRMRQQYSADGDAPYADLPMVVLVDAGSASAAEIVAGALKENDRALLIGDTTFGKGTVQVMYDVGDGALKLTIAQYLLTSDLSIQGVGVTPDIDVAPLTIRGDRISLGLDEERSLRDPRRKLDAFGKVADEKPVARVPYLVDSRSEDSATNEEDDDPLKEETFVRDEVIDLGAALVRSIRSSERTVALRESAPALQAWTTAQDARIVESMKQQGIDWSGPVAEPPASIRVAWSMDRPQPLVAGSKVKMRLTATNMGKTEASRVHCTTESEDPTLDGREFVFGRISPGETLTREVMVTVSKDAWSRVDQIAFRLFQGETELPGPEPVVIATRALPRPRFAFSWQIQDNAGNGDGLLSPGETVSILVDVKNVGDGPAEKVLVTVRNKSGDGVLIRDGRVTLKDGIPIGGAGTARFRIEVRRGFEAQQATLEIGILDLSVREYLAEEIAIRIQPSGTDRLIPRIQALRTKRDNTAVLAAASPDAAVFFRVPENFFLRSSGRLGAYYRVDLEEGRFAFVAETDVEAFTGIVRFPPLPETPQPMSVEPGVEVRVADPAGAGLATGDARISGQVRFAGHPGTARRKILIFRGNDKVFFWTHLGPTEEAVVPVDARIPLVAGKNDIAVYAIEGKDRSGVRRFTLFSSSGSSGAEGIR